LATFSTAQRQLVDWPPTWSKTEVIKTRKHPDCYTRVTLKDKLAVANISVLHLYDAVREALTSGLLIVSPPFPILTATAVAKQERVSTRQMPYQSAALILIFTPVDILLQQRFSFTFDPLGRNRPPSRTTRIPTLNKTQQNALAAANAWANELMQLSARHVRYPHNSFHPGGWCLRWVFIARKRLLFSSFGLRAARFQISAPLLIVLFCMIIVKMCVALVQLHTRLSICAPHKLRCH
jgi:hypothetical protein